MGKDVLIEVPTAHYELRAHPPEVNEQRVTLHFVVVPEEALAEVQEVLRKYQPQIDKFLSLYKKVLESKGE
jgi:hypothetical protein